MSKNLHNFKVVLLAIIFLPMAIFSQSLSGKITSGGNAVVGASVLVKSSGASVAASKLGAATDVDGNYSVKVGAGSYSVTVSSVGYASKTVKIAVAELEDKVLNVELNAEAKELDEIVILGSRSQERTVVDSPVPIDIFSFKEISTAGQNSFDKILQYRVPSFNVVQTPVNDATALMDPYEIRNMGISRTLILVNGKRKNLSALVYTQTSPSRGESGADISAFPVDAIKRVEVLRDGASAQYGSDAIAGVMNIVLKDNSDGGSFSFNSGMTGEGDGKKFGISFNNGSSIFEDKGFINYTVDLSKVDEARRSGKVDAKADADNNLGFGVTEAEVRAFLNKMNANGDQTDAAGNRSSYPATAAAKFVFNTGVTLSDNTDLYGNAAYVYKKVNSFANYRTPYWRTLGSYPYLKDFFGDGTAGSYIGYVPTFDGDLIDYNATVGVKTRKGEWNVDASATMGFNSIDYLVTNSHNKTGKSDSLNYYGAASPTSFRPGGTEFSHLVGNVDVTRPLSDKLSLGVGTEFRKETFSVIEGDRASYAGQGSDSYAGNKPENSGSWTRFNFGGYVDLGFDVTKNLLVAATFRQENYSDFGSASVYKISSRLKALNDKLTLRGSYSTGFKAPTLHQIYTQRSQYAFATGGAITIIGLINTVSPQARILGVGKLKPENSVNLAAGLGYVVNDDMNLTFDYYDIKVSDRIVISNRVVSSSGEAEFFTNSISTITQGVDVVFNYQNLKIGPGIAGLSLAGNVNLKNERDGDITKVKGTPVIDATQEALFFTSRPKQKFIFGTTYQLGATNLTLNNTYFGETKFHQAGIDANLNTIFEAKVVSDINIDYALNESLSLNVSLNNILDVTPKWDFYNLDDSKADLSAAKRWEQENLLTFNGRYTMMTYDGFHFSQLGRLFSFAVVYKF